MSLSALRRLDCEIVLELLERRPQGATVDEIQHETQLRHGPVQLALLQLHWANRAKFLRESQVWVAV